MIRNNITNINLTQNEIEEIMKLDKENNEEDNKIDIDEDVIEEKKEDLYKNQRGVTKLEMLEMKLEHLYESVYNELYPKIQKIIKSINQIKDLQRGEWDKNLLKPLLEEVIKENSSKLAEDIIKNYEKSKLNLKEENNLIEEEGTDLDSGTVRRFNFLYFSTKKEEMDKLFKKLKGNKHLIEMQYAETEDSEKKYYIVGKYNKQTFIYMKYYDNIILMDEGRNYQKSIKNYINPNKLIAKYPEDN